MYLNNIDQNKITEVLSRYSESLNRLGIRILSHSPNEDLILLRWWMHLHETDEINKLFPPESHQLHEFLSVFAAPTVIFYSLDSLNNIEFIAWFKEPSGKSIFAGIWSSEKLRGTKKLGKFPFIIYSLVFEFYSTIIGITWQPALLKLHIKMGYNVVGNLQEFMNQPIVWLVQMTKENFENSRFMKIYRGREV